MVPFTGGHTHFFSLILSLHGHGITLSASEGDILQHSAPITKREDIPPISQLDGARRRRSAN